LSAQHHHGGDDGQGVRTHGRDRGHVARQTAGTVASLALKLITRKPITMDSASGSAGCAIGAEVSSHGMMAPWAFFRAGDFQSL
jgi:hypothetical protein